MALSPRFRRRSSCVPLTKRGPLDGTLCSVSLRLSSLLALALALGCGAADAPPVASGAHPSADPSARAADPGAPETTAPPPTEEVVNDPRWHALFEEAANRYASWGRVDDRARWSPFDCMIPPPAAARFDHMEHGVEKLYTVYALDPEAYGSRPTFRVTGAGPSGLSGLPSPQAGEGPWAEVVQVLVKEAFVPVLEEERSGRPYDADERDLRPADGAWLHPARFDPVTLSSRWR